MSIKTVLDQLTSHIKPMLMDSDEVKESIHPDGEKEVVVTTEIPKKYTAKDIIGAIFNGLGVGLLLGLLLGLAVSPVVSAFIGTLSSVLVLLIGLNEKYFSVVKSIRIGSFGVFGVAGILLGFYVRSYSPLAPSLTDLKNEYISLGYSDTVAKELLLYQEFGLVPESWAGRIATPSATESDSTDGEAVAEKTSQPALMAQNVNISKRNNILFSSTVDVGACYMLEYSNNEMSFERLKKNFITAGGTWKELAENIDAGLPEQVRVNTLIIVRDVFCNTSNTETGKIKCIDFEQPVAEISLDNIKAGLKKSDPLWEQMILSIDGSVENQYQKQLYISLINIFCHD